MRKVLLVSPGQVDFLQAIFLLSHKLRQGSNGPRQAIPFFSYWLIPALDLTVPVFKPVWCGVHVIQVLT